MTDLLNFAHTTRLRKARALDHHLRRGIAKHQKAKSHFSTFDNLSRALGNTITSHPFGGRHLKGFRDRAIPLISAAVGFVTQIVDDCDGRNAAPSATCPTAA